MPRAAFLAITFSAVGLALAACDSGAAEDVAKAETAKPAVSTVEPAQLETLLKEGEVRLIDVRTDKEVAEGMIPGAEHIALDQFDPANLDLSDGREVILYCRSGRRSAVAAERLALHTGEPARHLGGGIKAWAETGRMTSPR